MLISAIKPITLILKLPTGFSENLPISSSTTISLVKNTIEKLYGIPVELQLLLHNGIKLTDEQTFQSINDNTITIFVEMVSPWYESIEKFLKGDNISTQYLHSIQTEIDDKMYRIFVMLFISAAQGTPANIITILSLHNDFNLTTTTKVTGRTLLHAAVNSGSLKCVEELKKFAGLNFEKLLYLKDKDGYTPTSSLTTNNLRMLNYINKFISNPLTLQDIRDSSDNHDLNSDNDRDEKLTAMTTTAVFQVPTENTSKQALDETRDLNTSEAYRPKTPEPNVPKTLPTLSRTKENNRSPSVSQKPHSASKSATLVLVSPITVERNETGKTLKVGKPLNQTKDPHKLPLIHQVDNEQNQKNKSLPTFARHPHPPVIQKSKKPVAGVLKESSARKFSAAQYRNNLSSTDGIIESKGHNFQPHSPRMGQVQRRLVPTEQTTTPENNEDHNAEVEEKKQKKVRRISLIQNPQTHQNGHTDENQINGHPSQQKIIEIEEDRMEKPWNNWIKAVTIDADSTEAKLNITYPITPEQTKARKVSLQIPQEPKVRKKSFDQWVLYKAQMEISELQRLRDENKHHEANEAEKRWKHGKTFEQWKSEKEEYDRMLKKQQEEDTKENKPVRKYLKGKSFQQWQREVEEHEKLEREMKKAMETREKEQRETSLQKRRKESTAKYEQWLMQKEMQELEKEVEAQQSVNKRKSSIASKSAFDRLKGRRRSLTM